jgi:hypothetical protein
LDLPGWLTAAASVAGVLGTASAALMHNALASRDEQISSLRTGQKIAFDKIDAQSRDLHEYKLHVAETYVNEAKLEKLFDPINRRLESIEKGLRDERGLRA